MTQKDDTIGRRIGGLKVAHALGRNERGEKLYGCKCDCGNPDPVVMTKEEIKDQRYTTCGCGGDHDDGEDDDFPF